MTLTKNHAYGTEVRFMLGLREPVLLVEDGIFLKNSDRFDQRLEKRFIYDIEKCEEFVKGYLLSNTDVALLTQDTIILNAENG